jgi:Domain of unknown function (DUF4124)
MHKWLILLSALGATAANSTPAWTWVDANGQTHFSDRPVPGARQVELSGAQGFGTQGAVTRTAASAATPAPAAAPGSGSPYATLEVVSPGDQETLWNIGGTLSVTVRVQPPLQPGHRLELALDGQRRNVSGSGPRFTLADVFRGAHTLQVFVLDSAGTEVARSPTRSFVVQQTSVQNPNSPIARQRAASGGN